MRLLSFDELQDALIEQAKENITDKDKLESYIEGIKIRIEKMKNGDMGNDGTD